MIFLQLIALIVSGFAVGMLAAGYDAERHKDEPGLNHASRLLFRGLWLVIVSFAFSGWSWQTVKECLVLTSSFFLIFDLAFNYLIGQRWYYLGTTANTDKWLAVLGGRLITVIEACILLVLAILYLT